MDGEIPVEAKIEIITEELENVILGPDGEPLSKKALKKLEKEREKERKKQERAAELAAEKAAREANSVDYAKDNYGKLEMNQSSSWESTKYTTVKDLENSEVGSIVTVVARVQTSRPTGAKMCFLVLREGTSTVQALVSVNSDTISKQMVKFADNISAESLVRVTAVIVKPDEIVKSCTVGNVELHIHTLFITSEATSRIPFSMEDATRPETEYAKDPLLVKVNLDTRLDNRVIDLRTITNNAIFRLQAAVCKLFREFLDTRDFVEIHSPKIISAASEGGANVFQVTYFKRFAYLAQSPQFYKQMCISSDFGAVYEIAPVFRAEDSNTHRHMTEYIGLDLEMSFKEHYHEVMFMIAELFIFIFKELEKRYAHEISIVQRQYPFEPIRYSEKPLRLEFKDAVALLREAGIEVDDYEDLSTANERILGSLVSEKYGTDFYMLDKFPTKIRPFYTMPDKENPLYSNSYDFFIRGEEIMSGAQRVHDAEFLETRIRECGIDPSTMSDYVNAFKYGCPPHAGGGVGLERVIMLYLNLGNIRRASLFPRDPKRLDP
ncbi:Aspartate-tRNA ligase, cytoplasmic [Smittium mucronatum]|uniref:Aspartate--tRNA ligase, cytoplasmic n=1 Tax=Smittium mucronatum TaxID=133383 RepID=A0A1R0GZF7_9FUNG|nr:Aspartate-tRNA ligase, cytoplasmic [Smittium mucronatum]